MIVLYFISLELSHIWLVWNCRSFGEWYGLVGNCRGFCECVKMRQQVASYVAPSVCRVCWQGGRNRMKQRRVCIRKLRSAQRASNVISVKHLYVTEHACFVKLVAAAFRNEGLHVLLRCATGRQSTFRNLSKTRQANGAITISVVPAQIQNWTEVNAHCFTVAAVCCEKSCL